VKPCSNLSCYNSQGEGLGLERKEKEAGKAVRENWPTNPT